MAHHPAQGEDTCDLPETAVNQPGPEDTPSEVNPKEVSEADEFDFEPPPKKTKERPSFKPDI